MVVAPATCTQLAIRTQEEQQTGTLETLASLPVTRFSIALALAAYPFLLGLLRSTLYLMVAFLLMRVEVGTADWPGGVCVLLLGALGATTLGNRSRRLCGGLPPSARGDAGFGRRAVGFSRSIAGSIRKGILSRG